MAITVSVSTVEGGIVSECLISLYGRIADLDSSRRRAERSAPQLQI